jgi:hypothetical protein
MASLGHGDIVLIVGTPVVVPSTSSGAWIMRRMTRLGLGVAVGLGALLGMGWLGLQVEPAPFPSYPDPAPKLDAMALPADLPAPAARYCRTVLGDQVPIINSAVISGRGRIQR